MLLSAARKMCLLQPIFLTQQTVTLYYSATWCVRHLARRAARRGGGCFRASRLLRFHRSTATTAPKQWWGAFLFAGRMYYLLQPVSGPQSDLDPACSHSSLLLLMAIRPLRLDSSPYVSQTVVPPV